jgi:hypothetical protein
MYVYWTDIRAWLTTALIATPIVLTAGLFGWILTSNLFAAIGVGVGWQFLTRLSIYIDLRIRANPEELETGALWRELRWALRHYKDGQILVTDDREVELTVHRAKMRAFERTISRDIELPRDDGLRGILPRDYFLFPGRAGGFVFRDATPLCRNDNGEVVTAEGTVRATPMSRREYMKLLELEINTGTLHVPLHELRELVEQVRSAAPSH